jgi:exopolysaccharide biosynthesis protein
VDRSVEPLHPRTAIGTDPTGRQIYMVVVDGRQPGTSEGMATGELAERMAQLGCHAAINLDGGGTSILFHADESGRLRIANRPADPATRPTPLLLVVRKLASPPPAPTIPAP